MKLRREERGGERWGGGGWGGGIFFFQAEDGIRDYDVTGVQTCALPICFLGNVLRVFVATEQAKSVVTDRFQMSFYEGLIGGLITLTHRQHQFFISHYALKYTFSMPISAAVALWLSSLLIAAVSVGAPSTHAAAPWTTPLLLS
mgnify:CR=1 FL=1